MNTLGFERLEDRVLLAASISKKGCLTVCGTDCDDCIKIFSPCAGVVVVEVNGCCETFCGVKEIKVDAKGGCDYVSICNVDICCGKLSVKGGCGNDCISFDGCINAKVCVDCGDGCDRVNAECARFKCGVDIKCGDGNDHCEISRCCFEECCSIDCGKGDDCIRACENFCAKDVKILCCAGDDNCHWVSSETCGKFTCDGGKGCDSFCDYGSSCGTRVIKNCENAPA